MWVVTLLLWENFLLQMLQWKGFSPLIKEITMD
jgi:hypothetical protein